jgi:hypothetical protein
MIAYDLKCARGHVFEGWFDDDTAFLTQQQQGLVNCPICNDADVVRIPSTFAIRPAGGSASGDHAALAAVGRHIAAYIRDHFDDVGCAFAKEALKIHYGVTEPRNIRGSSTPQEEKTLRDEGVAFLKIPLPRPSESDA